MRNALLALIFVFCLFLPAAVEAAEPGSPAEVVERYWEAVIREDYEGAYLLVADRQKKRLTEAQFIAHQECIAEHALYIMEEVTIEKSEPRREHTVVYLTLKTTGVLGERLHKGSDKVVRERGRWRLLLTDKFIKAATSPPVK